MDAELVAVVLTLLGGLVVFGLLVVVGGWLVRRLRIVGEPPDQLAFDPAPPDPRDPDRTTAPKIAKAQAERTALHRLAWEARTRADEAASLVSLAPDAATRSDWEKRAESLAEQATRAKELLDGLPGKAVALRRLAAEGEKDQASLRALVEPHLAAHTAFQRRRLLVLVILLVLAVAAAVTVYHLRPAP